MESSRSSNDVERNLNPEAPEFFPPTRNVVVSTPPPPIFSPYLQHQHQTLAFPYAHAISTPLFPPSLYPYPPSQHALPLHLLSSAAADTPVAEPVSFLLEPLKTKLVIELQEEEGEEEEEGARKAQVVGGRTRNKAESRHVRRYFDRRVRYGKEGFGFGRGEYHHHGQSVKKEWRAKRRSGDGGGGGGAKGLLVDRNADDGHEASFNDHYHHASRKVIVWGGNNKNREKHPPIPVKWNGMETTVMIRNIPNKYTRAMLKEMLDNHCMLTNSEIEILSRNGSGDHEEEEQPSLSAFDFLYLPIDFVTKSNKGYAFVNFTNPGGARKLFDAWHNTRWGTFNSNKIREIYCARHQGIEKIVNHCARMEFPSEEFQPLSFNPARDGSNKVVEETRIGKCSGSTSYVYPTKS